MKRKVTIIIIVMITMIGFYLGYRQSKMAQWDGQLHFSQFNYETIPILESKLSLAIHNKIPVQREDIERICGKPDSINNDDRKYENWHYRITDQQKPQYYDVTITFDKSGKMVNLISRHRIIEPAIVNLIMTESYWKEKVLSRIVPKFLNPSNKQYVIQVEARIDLSAYVLNGPDTQVEQINRRYTRQLFPGSYNFYLVVMDQQNYRKIQEILLQENVQLSKNETRDMRL